MSNFGCASIERSTLLGATTGIGVGVLSTSATASGYNQKFALKGVGLGMLVGGLTGYILHKVVDQRESQVRKETLFNLESHGIVTSIKDIELQKYNSFLTSPQVREDYVETHTTEDGRKLIQGHKVWKIIGQPQFNLAKPKNKKIRR